jgi:hypothetical protein
MGNAHKKPVIHSVSMQPLGGPKLNPKNFIKSINSKGYNVTIEKAMRCSCVGKATGQGVPSCVNCFGVGWIWINKRETKLVMQSSSRDTQFRPWIEAEAGRVVFTAKPGEEIGYMDRIVNNDLISVYSQTVQLDELSRDAKLVYPILEIKNAYLFKSLGEKHVAIDPDVDLTFDFDKVELVNLALDTGQNLSLSIRYTHRPTFHVIDIPREDVATERDRCDGMNVIQHLPVHVIARRAQFLLDKSNSAGNGPEDNSFIGTDRIF